MDDKLQSFIANSCGTRGKLARVEAEIYALLLAGATYGEIVTFLAQLNIKADRAEIYRYVNRKARKQRLMAIKGGTSCKKENGSDCVEVVAPGIDLEVRPGAPRAELEKSASAEPALPTFDWNQMRKNCKLNW